MLSAYIALLMVLNRLSVITIGIIPTKSIEQSIQKKYWNEKHSGDKFDDPLMNDPEEGDYSLYDKSLKLGAVYDERVEIRKLNKDKKEKDNNKQKTTDDSEVITEK